MFGVSLQYSTLRCYVERKECPEYGDNDRLFRALWRAHVRSVEVRAVAPGSDPHEVEAIIRFLWSKGMNVTVHGSMRSSETAAHDVLDPLRTILPWVRSVQNFLTITLHPIARANKEAISSILVDADVNDFPIKLAIENNRYMPEGEDADTTEFVSYIIENFDRKRVGACFDMGHYYNYVRRHGLPDLQLPSPRFLGRVIHTHIHALSEDLTTHFPVGLGFSLPLANYAAAIGFNYEGIWNMELEAGRWKDLYQPSEATVVSAAEVYRQINMPSTVNLDVTRHFAARLENAVGIWDKKPPRGKIAFSVIRSSSYVFNENGVKWALDLSFTKVRNRLDKPIDTAKSFGGMDFMIVSHLHDDHYDPALVRELSELGVKLIMPPFVAEAAIREGVKEENVIVCRAGEPLEYKGITILPTEGCHYRPSGDGIDAYGFYVTCPGYSSMMFPSDVRDYSKEPTVPGPIDRLFMHIWMGDMTSNRSSFKEWDEDFVRFASKYKPKEAFLCHLYENGRNSSYMWRREHAEHLIRLGKKSMRWVKMTAPQFGRNYLI